MKPNILLVSTPYRPVHSYSKVTISFILGLYLQNNKTELIKGMQLISTDWNRLLSEILENSEVKCLPTLTS